MTRATVSSSGFARVFAAHRACAASWLAGTRLHMLPRLRRISRSESGSSIVEFAMSSVILFTLIFGIMGICLALYAHNVTSEAAREATRYAIVRGSACNSFPDCNVNQTQLQTYIQSIPWPGINSKSLTIPAANGLSWPDGNNHPGSQVKVTVTYTFPLLIPFGHSRMLSVSSTSQMVISQ